jgi:hypothetical protein
MRPRFEVVSSPDGTSAPTTAPFQPDLGLLNEILESWLLNRQAENR